MTRVQELIEKQKLINNPPTPPAPDLDPAPLNHRIDELIAKAKEYHANPVFEDLEIELGGELVTVSIAHAWPNDWSDLEATHPPTSQEDRNTGYNRRTLPRDYPTDRIKIDGASLDADTWKQLYDVIDPEQQDNVSALLWGLNVLEPMQRDQQAATAIGE